MKARRRTVPPTARHGTRAGSISGVRGGAVGPTRRWLRRLRLAAEILLVLVAFGALLLWCSIPNTARLADQNPTSTAFIDLRRSQAHAAGTTFDLKWEWRPIGKISRYLRAAVIYAEDARFYTHEGVDWDAIEKALDRNLEEGELSVGGSTITQQLAKNLYLSPSRSLVRKAREMLIAFSLEDHLPKQRILELYLNVAEWGDGVFGAEAAAKKWFGHTAQNLSPSEAARLAIALPNPFTRAPNVHTDELRKKAVRIIRLFRMEGLVDAAQERAALDEVGANSAIVRPDSSAPPAGTSLSPSAENAPSPRAGTTTPSTDSSPTPSAGTPSPAPAPSAAGSPAPTPAAPADPMPPEGPGTSPSK